MRSGGLSLISSNGRLLSKLLWEGPERRRWDRPDVRSVCSVVRLHRGNGRVWRVCLRNLEGRGRYSGFSPYS